jgi:cytochrome c-type biogenesis protein CcmH/NrfG
VEGDRLYFKIGDFQKALTAYRVAQDVDPDSAMLWRKVGLCRVKLGQLPRAVEALENARRLAPNDAAILNTLAVLLLKSKQPKLARVHAASAVRIRPDDPNVWDTLAEAQASLKDTRGAIASYRKVLQLDPKNGKAKAALKKLGATAEYRKR